MYLTNFSLCMAFFLMISPAMAQENPLLDAGKYDASERKAAHMRSEWLVCNNTSDCGLVFVPCLPSLAVRLDKKIKAQAAICASHDNNCPPSCDASMEDTSKAVCQNGQCVTVFGPRGK